MNVIDSLVDTKIQIDGQWVIARPQKQDIWYRLNDAWDVLWGKAEAVTFWGQ